MSKKDLIFKLLWQLFGIIFFALGVGLIITSKVGASPFDAVVNYTMLLTNYGDQGFWLFMWSILFTIVIYALTRRWQVFVTLGVSLLISFTLNQWITLLEMIIPSDPNIFLSYIIGLSGLVSLAMGIGALIAKKLFLTPYDEVSLYLETKIGNYAISKSILDGTSLVLAIVLALIIGKPDGKLLGNQVGLFSAVVVFGLGPLISLFIKLFEKGSKKDEVK